ncbi:hypothetical protein BHE74_00043513 [Ensete ventricosum]|uniref:Uncharacterized protein n=1 Tax=Ensete ventricosum TaxID=4639 RepID=A0A426XAN0_ENSVE|nr:hypothetical protein B296_00056616 [Ensete ventricosum]RWV76819.1 hypothetical protein GW17_00062457 [Ensete ventricosum]RWW50245.1 hypothetical protein BHE74_00043513 [Ensete ventricosum]RZR90892.1 hypothetical protein BHM03_00018894 [Ensete ventricosum]
MPVGEEQILSAKKVALRELPNESKNKTNKPLLNSLPKDCLKGLTHESGKVVGSKRQQPDGPPSPSSNLPQVKVSPLANLVYTRRKLETEQGKMGACVYIDHAESPELRKLSSNCTKRLNMQKELILEPKATSSMGLAFPHSHGKSISRLAGPEPQDSTIAAAECPFPADPPHKVHNEGWKDRFLRLQMFLKTCDQSHQEDYIQMLRSLSAIGRSRHAVELEKRAIYLLLEEGKELQRMKALNVLGKSQPNDHASILSQTPLASRAPER